MNFFKRIWKIIRSNVLFFAEKKQNPLAQIRDVVRTLEDNIRKYDIGVEDLKRQRGNAQEDAKREMEEFNRLDREFRRSKSAGRVVLEEEIMVALQHKKISETITDKITNEIDPRIEAMSNNIKSLGMQLRRQAANQKMIELTRNTDGNSIGSKYDIEFDAKKLIIELESDANSTMAPAEMRSGNSVVTENDIDDYRKELGL